MQMLQTKIKYFREKLLAFSRWPLALDLPDIFMRILSPADFADQRR